MFVYQEWSIGRDIEANMTAGYLTSKVACLVETLLEYRLADLAIVLSFHLPIYLHRHIHVCLCSEKYG